MDSNFERVGGCDAKRGEPHRDGTRRAARFEQRGDLAAGLVVTAEHALRRDEEIQLTLPDDKVASAKLIGRDPSTDLAVLKCEEAKTAPANLGETGSLKAQS